MKELPEDTKFLLEHTSKKTVEYLIERYGKLQQGAGLMEGASGVGGQIFVAVSAYDLRALCHYAIQHMEYVLGLKDEIEEQKKIDVEEKLLD